MLSWRKFDWVFFLNIIFIVSLGTVIVFSVTPTLIASQIIYVFLSLTLFFLFAGLDYRIFENFGWMTYLLTLLILSLPFLFGVLIKGAARWIQLGPVSFQPSELAKPLLVIFSAGYWSKKEFSFRNLLIFFFLMIFPFVMIFRQPDLGSSLVILSITLGAIFVSEINFKQILWLILVVLLVLPTGWFFLREYQRQRIEHFFDPYSDPLGAGYNVIQAMITVGSGQLLGKGLGKGTQSHLAFLPERHTDFIFASFAEEFGFLGSLFLLGLYFFLYYRPFSYLKKIKDKFALILVTCSIFFLFFQTMINIGMNLGLLPVTGITLPLFSYGGNSLISTMIVLGMVMNVIAVAPKDQEMQIGI